VDSFSLLQALAYLATAAGRRVRGAQRAAAPAAAPTATRPAGPDLVGQAMSTETVMSWEMDADAHRRESSR
jgi:hypothetical protein